MNFDLKIDIANGTFIYPNAIEYSFHSLLDEQIVINVLSYTIENIIAEKYETILDRGESNGRMRDFFDVYSILENDKSLFSDCIFETILKVCENRGTLKNIVMNEALLKVIKDSQSFSKMWKEYGEIQPSSKNINLDLIFDLLLHLGSQCNKLLK